MRRKKKHYIQKTRTYLSYFSTESPPELRHLLSENKYRCACAKEACGLYAQPRFHIFHQLLIVVEAIWSQLGLQVYEQVEEVRNEIRAVRKVVKQLPVEILQQF
jgi:hypothetical protein